MAATTDVVHLAIGFYQASFCACSWVSISSLSTKTVQLLHLWSALFSIFSRKKPCFYINLSNILCWWLTLTVNKLAVCVVDFIIFLLKVELDSFRKTSKEKFCTKLIISFRFVIQKHGEVSVISTLMPSPNKIYQILFCTFDHFNDSYGTQIV